ncbi:hypothetical protein VTI74DRAFT_3205 [Chaetomium olivicolor]
MNANFFHTPLSPEEARRRMAMQQQQQQGQAPGRGMVNSAAGIGSGLDHVSPLSGMDAGGMQTAGDSLDDIVNQNTRELQRRRSIQQPFPDDLSPQGVVDRRMSIMDFGNTGDALQGFQFGSMGGEALGGLGGYAGGAPIPGTSEPFAQQGMMAMAGQPGYGTLAPESIPLDAFTGLEMGQVAAGPCSMSLYQSPDVGNQYQPSALDAVSPDFAMDMPGDNPTMSAPNVTGFAVGGGGDMMGVGETFGAPSVPQEPPGLMPNPRMPQYQATLSHPEPRENTFHSPASTNSHALSQSSAGLSRVGGARTPASTAPTVAGPLVPAGPARRGSKKDVYSKSGFDMLRALWYVATRKNATVEIGAVDMSCAFVVCDVTLNDCPIIYVSDNFQNLTGYNRHEIVGQNCRFLQSPDGKVEAGSRREFVANDAVFKLKTSIAEGREIQQSLINYRKGGKPFLNLLTMIPIPWDSDEIRYCIGFQIDLVECPDAISGESGTMQVNYRHSDIGQYIFTPPTTTQFEPESGNTLGVDEVSKLIEQYDQQVVSDWLQQSWDKMLLENADDVVHVLSLKGLFLYLSPACKKVLEYDTLELVGASLSSICHPSDIVPVTRELKDAQQNAPVNIAFRIRRKNSGYTWFESHGTLLYEQSKGRKYLILVGRKRPVYSLRRRDVDLYGAGIGESEIWSKVSTAGMFLHVSSSAKTLLDMAPADLEGTSMQDLMRKESRQEFGRTIEKARKGGAVVSFRHEVLHRRGQLLAAQTMLYPGDVQPSASTGQNVKGGRPSFLIAQTKVARASGRVIAGGKTSAAAEREDVAEEEDDNIFAELKTTRCTSWQYELRQMEKVNRLLAEELSQLMANKKKRKRRKGGGSGSGMGGGAGGNGGGVVVRDCANCHRKDTPEWRRGPSGNRDLCNSCGLRWAKQTGKVSPRNTSRAGSDPSAASKRASSSTASTNSPVASSPLRREVSADAVSVASSGMGSSGMERGSASEAGGNGWSIGGGMGPIREE